jgi:hypothetical protein
MQNYIQLPRVIYPYIALMAHAPRVMILAQVGS